MLQAQRVLVPYLRLYLHMPDLKLSGVNRNLNDGAMREVASEQMTFVLFFLHDSKLIFTCLCLLFAQTTLNYAC